MKSISPIKLNCALKYLALCVCVSATTVTSCGPEIDPRVSATAPVVYQYSIGGMHCQGCVDAITDKVTHINGVVDCRVNLKDNSATIAVRDASIEPNVKVGIEKLGYTVMQIENAPVQPKS